MRLLQWCLLTMLVIALADSNRCQFGELLYKGYPFTPFPLKRTIVFDTAFEEEPAFMYAIKMLDLNYAENTRAAVDLKNLTNQRFTLEMKTVHDTQMYGLGVTWMACPSV